MRHHKVTSNFVSHSHKESERLQHNNIFHVVQGGDVLLHGGYNSISNDQNSVRWKSLTRSLRSCEICYMHPYVLPICLGHN